MFYRAALGLPFFAWGAGGALSLGGASAPSVVVAVAGVAVPRLYLLLAGNVVGDYCCKVGLPCHRPASHRPASHHPVTALPNPTPPTRGCPASRQSLHRPQPHCAAHPWPPRRKVSMTRLVGEASALAATMVITLQRLASLVFSATVLSPAYPPAGLWAGICLVALGSVGYLGSPSASTGGAQGQRPASSEVRGKKRL